MITKERLEAAKQYMRVDFDDDDSLIETLLAGADAYLNNAGIQRDDDPALYDSVAWDMALNRYDKRGEGTETLSPMARLNLNQLKFCAGRKEAGNDEKSDGGETPP